MWWADQCSQLGVVPLMFVVEKRLSVICVNRHIKTPENLFHRLYYMHKIRLKYEVEGRKLKEATCDSKTQLMTHI
jgi:hypothetical protein